MDLNSKLASEQSRGRLHELPKTSGRAILIGTYLSGKNKPESEEQLNELASLCDTFGLTSVFRVLCPIRAYDPATFIGKGKVEEIKALTVEHQADLVIFDDEISPQQQRNLEKTVEHIVIDRTELILGVFAQRAQSREARIQIELATCRYQLPRLTRLWTHLERQRTGRRRKRRWIFKGHGREAD